MSKEKDRANASVKIRYNIGVQLHMVRDIIKTLIFFLLLVIIVKGTVSFWQWSSAQITIEQERAAQETFLRKGHALTYYELVDDYNMLLEMVVPELNPVEVAKILELIKQRQSDKEED